MMMIALAAAAALRVASCASLPVGAFRADDQALLDGIGAGNRALWNRMLAPDALIVDENSRIVQRSEFLKELTPFPPHVSGSLMIDRYQAHADGDTAWVVLTEKERESYHGIALQAAYVTSETWLCRGNAWKIAMIQIHVQARDPPPISLAESSLDKFVGRYKAGDDLFWTIRRDGGHLTGQRDGGAIHPLMAETRDVFFVPGDPRERWIFQYDTKGRVIGFVERREDQNILWVRVS